MDEAFLNYYNRELQFLREQGGEFAEAFPKIAGRLGLDKFSCADPYVERLLEAFAFLAARVHLKVDAEFPRFTESLLEILYPHYLSPTPSMLVAKLVPYASLLTSPTGVLIPAGSLLKSKPVYHGDEKSICYYKLATPVELLPLALTKASYTTHLAHLNAYNLAGFTEVKAALHLQLKVLIGNDSSEQVPWSFFELKELPLFLRGDLEFIGRLYEQLLSHTLGVIIRPLEAEGSSSSTARVGDYEILGSNCLTSMGFTSDEALLPYSARSFSGYRLLQEYFAFKERFLFVKLLNLQQALKKFTKAGPLEIIILLKEKNPLLEGPLNKDNIQLFCAPAINLFTKHTDRINLHEGSSEYHVVPDRTRPLNFEVHSLKQVIGYGDNKAVKREFRPFYQEKERDLENLTSESREQEAYYLLQRKPRIIPLRQTVAKGQVSYNAFETFISLIDGPYGAYASELKELAIEALCTNRDLPLYMPIGSEHTDFTTDAAIQVEKILCVAGPSTPYPSMAKGDVSWRLINHLSLNYNSLLDMSQDRITNKQSLQKLLYLYAPLSNGEAPKQIEALKSMSSQAVIRHLPILGEFMFARGLEVTLNFDEVAFAGSNVFLLGVILAKFFQKYTSINTFIETVVKTPQRGEILRLEGW